jgi:hypothetical protein
MHAQAAAVGTAAVFLQNGTFTSRTDGGICSICEYGESDEIFEV